MTVFHRRTGVQSLEENPRESLHEALSHKLVDRLARMVVVIPHAAGAVRVRRCDVCVEVVRGRIVEDFPEVRRSVEDLGQRDIAVGCLEVLKVADERRVESVEVGSQCGEVCLVHEGGSFVEGCGEALVHIHWLLSKGPSARRI